MHQLCTPACLLTGRHLSDSINLFSDEAHDLVNTKRDEQIRAKAHKVPIINYPDLKVGATRTTKTRALTQPNKHFHMKVNFNKSPDGLIPAVVQDSRTLRVLMLGYMNEEAFSKTQKEKRVTFFSRSKQRLWTKGESSGFFLEVAEFRVDCDNDTILIKAIPSGPVCHTGSDTCFNEKNEPAGFLTKLGQIIESRKGGNEAGSYTSQLFKKGINKIAQKVGEEATELIIEAKDNDQELFLNEAADLLFHYLVLLSAKGKNLKDVEEVLRARHVLANGE